MITLVGSRAARRHFPDFREPKDLDLISDKPFEYTPIRDNFDMDCEPLKFDIFVDERLASWDWDKIATPEELYTMKVSHSFWEINRNVQNWNKHMADIVFFQRKGVEFIRPLYDILFPIHKELHGKKKTSLAQNAENFFTDGVNRTYVHDSIHDSIAYKDRPMYESILVPGEEVMTDINLFWAMSHEDKIKTVREEVYATALERILIPNNYAGSPRAAYAWALRRTITSLFKGEWALWTVLNYDELARPDCDYLQRHLDNRDRLVLL